MHLDYFFHASMNQGVHMQMDKREDETRKRVASVCFINTAHDNILFLLSLPLYQYYSKEIVSGWLKPETTYLLLGLLKSKRGHGGKEERGAC